MRQTFPDGRQVQYRYDAGGNLTALIPPGRDAHVFEYDVLGQESAYTPPELTEGATVTRYRYNLTARQDNRTVSLIYNSGDMTLQRNAANGLLDGTGLLNTASRHGYNTFGELAGSAISHGGNTVTAMNYTRDQLGRITARAEAVAGTSLNESYTYDLSGRLTGVTRNGQSTTWQYDSNGNRTHENGELIATYDAQDRLLSYRGASYGYTQNGELLSKSENGAITSYHYDELGNLLSVQLSGDLQIEYLIDGRNRRIGKKVNGSLTQAFLYKDQLTPRRKL